MKNKTAQTTMDISADDSLSKLQTLALLATLVLAGTAAYLGSKTLLNEMPESVHSDTSDYLWSELERAVSTLTR